MSNSVAIGVAYQDQDITGGSLNDSPIGATTPSTIVGTTVYGSSEIGYSSAAQGTVTQATSKSTGVTLNKSMGKITMNAASLGAGASVTFTLTNSAISANDVVIASISGGGTAGAYWPYVSSQTTGSAVIGLWNSTGGALAEAVVINFAVIHGAS
jgi:uncharacterized protein YbjQ (UPF0145 family)